MATILDALPLVGTLRDAMFLSATVSEIDQLTPTMRRVRFSGPRLRGLNWTPGQHVRLQVAGLIDSVLRLHPHDALRTYSIYDADPDAGTLDIVMCSHSYDGAEVTPARRWSATASVGDVVNLTRPQGNLVIRRDTAYHLFAGEETASVAFAAMLRSLHPDSDVYGVVEAATAADHLTLTRPLTRVERGDTCAADSPVLAEALRALDLPEQPGFAYLAGEARTIVSLRKILVTERGWDRRQIRTKPFWTPGRTGME